MRRLLIHADDFGLTRSVSTGIVTAIREGVVTGTAAMVCAEGAREVIADLAPEIPGRVGLHLQLTDGVPVSDPATVPSLIAFGGRFPRRRYQLGRLDPGEVRREWLAQLAALRALGIEPAYLDSHHHVHKQRGASAVYCQLAAELGVPARAGTPKLVEMLRGLGVVCADAFTDRWYGRELTPAGLVACLLGAAERQCRDASREGQSPGRGGSSGGVVVELMCHPGEVDEQLALRSSYVDARAQELAALCAPALPALLAEAGFERVQASDLVLARQP